MRRLAWRTGIHLIFVTPGDVNALCRAVRAAGVDAILLVGDVGEVTGVATDREGLDAGLGLPIDFVLGNHDFYRGRIARTRARAGVEALYPRSPRPRWMPWSAMVGLTDQAGLVGHVG
jgi:3',5'-cyclic-AMP phosphodiesterase